MKRNNCIKIFSILAVIVLQVYYGCTPVVTDPLSAIRIEVTGTSVNPVNITWTIHGTSGTLGPLVLNNGIGNPAVIQRYVPVGAYGEVSFAVTDSGATSANAILNGATATLDSGITEKVLVLDTDTEVPLGSGNFVATRGDFFEDATGDLMFILQDPSENGKIVVSDVNGDFTAGAWTLYKSNRSTITVDVTRDGLTLHTSTLSTNIDPVDLSYGSYAW